MGANFGPLFEAGTPLLSRAFLRKKTKMPIHWSSLRGRRVLRVEEEARACLKAMNKIASGKIALGSKTVETKQTQHYRSDVDGRSHLISGQCPRTRPTSLLAS